MSVLTFLFCDGDGAGFFSASEFLYLDEGMVIPRYSPAPTDPSVFVSKWRLIMPILIIRTPYVNLQMGNLATARRV